MIIFAVYEYFLFHKKLQDMVHTFVIIVLWMTGTS